MNNLVIVAELTVILLSVLGLVFLVTWAWSDYQVDRFRQQMFELRHQFFLEAKKGSLSFDDNAYGILRFTMNGFIRFAHRISLGHALMLMLTIRNDDLGVPLSALLKHEAQNLNPGQQEIIQKYYAEMNRLLVSHLLWSSPVLSILLLGPAYVLSATSRVVNVAQKLFDALVRRLDRTAYACGAITFA